MRRHAQPRVPWARLVDAFAEDADYRSILGRAPDRILFSYSLSMIADPARALRRAVDALAPGGEVVVVDFGGFGAVPPMLRESFRGFLAAFHVRPVAFDGLGPHALREGGLGYYVSARFRAASRDPDPLTSGC
jgi:S-adenosylmethionine-diacylgycerolhomoserine-N-methlytransferase